MPVPKKRISVVMVGPGGEEIPISTDDAPFDEAARASIQREVIIAATNAAAKMGLADFRVPPITEKSMKRSAAGLYKPKDHAIILNMLLLQNPREYRKTLVHEMAHAVVNELFDFHVRAGKRLYAPEWKHHGSMWLDVIRHMGMEAESHHDLDVVKAMPDKYLSQVCGCGYRHQVGKRAVANAIAKGRKWSCGTCRRPLDMSKWAPTPMSGGKRRHTTRKRRAAALHAAPARQPQASRPYKRKRSKSMAGLIRAAEALKAAMRSR